MELNYIKMCKAADEIQKMKLDKIEGVNEFYIFKPGDIYSDHGSISDDYLYQVCAMEQLIEVTDGTEKPIWLPTFDQLLGRYKKTLSNNSEFFAILHFSNYVQEAVSRNHEIGLVFTTKEMWALAFVMQAMYGKCWSYNRFKRALCGEFEGEFIQFNGNGRRAGRQELENGD